MKNEYIMPAINVATISNEQAMLVGTNGNNWAEGKEQDVVEDDDFFSEEFIPNKDMSIKNLWNDEEDKI